MAEEIIEDTQNTIEVTYYKTNQMLKFYMYIIYLGGIDLLYVYRFC